MYVHMCVCKYVSMYLSTYEYMYTCIYVSYMYGYHVHIYKHIKLSMCTHAMAEMSGLKSRTAPGTYSLGKDMEQ